MEFINEKIIQLLIRERHELCVSVYMPTHRIWNEIDQDLLRFKNLIKRVDKELTEKNIPANKKEKILAPLKERRIDSEFWRYQQDGLALFMTENEFYYVKLPINFEEEVFIGPQFHILPLIPALTETFDFYLLLLDQKDMKLYRSHHYTLEPVNVQDLPKDLEEALASDYPGRNLQSRQHTGAGGATNYHGHGDDSDASKQKENITEYFRRVNEAIMKVIGDDIIPLLPVGVEYLHSLYRDANTYPYLYNKGITRKPSSLREDDLYYEANVLLEPHFSKVKSEALKLYGNLVSTERASDDISEIVKAAFSKRISHLFVNPGQKKWGNFDIKNFDVILNNERSNGDIELLGLAVSETIKNNGLVYLLEENKMPNGKPIAAIFRY